MYTHFTRTFPKDSLKQMGLEIVKTRSKPIKGLSTTLDTPQVDSFSLLEEMLLFHVCGPGLIPGRCLYGFL